MFVELNRLESFTKVAVHLGLSQPTVSQALAKVEELLECRLALRNPNSVELTIEGRKFAKLAQALLDNAEANIVDIMPSDKPDLLRIGLPYFMSYPIVSQKLRAFSERHPSAKFEIIERSSAGLCEALSEDQVDLIFIPDPAPTSLPKRANQKVVWEKPLVLGVPKSKFESSKIPLTADDVRDMEFVFTSRKIHPLLYDHRIGKLKDAGLQPAILETEATNLQSYMLVASAAKAACFVAREDVEVSQELVLRETAFDLGSHRLRAYWKTTPKPSKALERFLSVLGE